MVLTFSSDDLGRTEEFLSAQYAPMRIGSATEDTYARVRRAASAAVSVDRLEVAFEMTYEVTPLGRISLCHIESGTIDDHAPVGLEPETYGQDEVFSFSPPDRPYRGRINRARYTITMIDPSLLARLTGATDGTVRLLDHRPVSAAAAARLRGAIDHLGRHVLADPDASASPLLVSTAQQYVAAQVLNAFPTVDDRPRSDSNDAHPATLRRAMAYLEAHADADVSPADVAEAAHVSVRAVQLAFRRYLDTTPTAYLRDLRLEHVRRDLLATDPTRSTVAGVAGRWGFSHLGHFGAAYRTRYSETPGETLRRG